MFIHSTLIVGFLLTSWVLANPLTLVKRSGTPSSPDGSTIPPATYLLDNIGGNWTVNGVAFDNGNPVAGSPANITLLLWYGGNIYAQQQQVQFFVWSRWAWLSSSDPRVPLCAPGGMFYGMNGHYDYPFTPAQTINYLQGLGVTTYRLGTINDPISLNPTVAMASSFQRANLTLFALVNYGLYNTSGLWGSEALAYQASFEGAAGVATALKPYGVKYYECGNELPCDPSIFVLAPAAGNYPADYNNTNWPILRGVMRGMIDGVKSAQSDALVGINFCTADTGASDLLWEGLQPDGTSGYPKVRWDFTTWHNYEPYGDIFAIGTDGALPGFSIPTYCKARYGVPFMLTEWNSEPYQDPDVHAAYVTKNLGEFYNARGTDGFQSTMFYELYSGNNNTWGIILNGEPLDPIYSAFQTFLQAHPDNETCPSSSTSLTAGSTSSGSSSLRGSWWAELLWL